MIKLYLLSTLKLSDEKVFEAACRKLDAGRLEKVSQAKRREDKILRAGAGLLLQYAVKKSPVFDYKADFPSCQIVSLEEVLEGIAEPEQFAFRYGPHGKPYFADRPELFFSLSHSGNYVLCALSDREVGADIQMIPPDTEKQREREERIAERFFSEPEREFLNRGNSGWQELTEELSNRRRERFYQIWAAKEAYMKQTGKGLSQGLDNFTVDLEQGTVQEEKTFARMYEIAASAGYAAAVAVENREQERK